MSPQTHTINGTLFTFTECINCGVTYCLPTALWNHQTLKGGYHHCPNGHRQGWNLQETAEAKLRRERDSAIQQVARAEDEAREARLRAVVAEKSAQSLEKSMRSLKKRVAAGTCPCCHRTFSNMNIHMQRQHPAFVQDNIIPLKNTSGLKP